jgi:hypothetical protein
VGNKAALKVRVSTFSSRIATLADIERVAPLPVSSVENPAVACSDAEQNTKGRLVCL